MLDLVSENNAVRSSPALDIEAVYREHGGRCFSLARRVVRDPHLAQDVVQEVFATLVRTPDTFDPQRGSLQTWLMTLTHRRAVDLVRSRGRRVALDSPDDALAFMPDQHPGPADAACLSDNARIVDRAVRQLDAGDREVILLAYFGGYSQSEIAERLGMPLGTVKSRTRHGMLALREQLRGLANREGSSGV